MPFAWHPYGPPIALDERRMIRQFLFITLVFGMIANAETISLSPINDGKGTIGTLSGFQAVDGSITIATSGNVDILLNFNSQSPAAGAPRPALGPYPPSALPLTP